MLSAGAGADGSQRLAGPPAALRQPGYCSYHAQGAHAMHQIRTCGYYLFSSVRLFIPNSISSSYCQEIVCEQVLVLKRAVVIHKS